ncbi:MAG TPA: bifunctional UDP-N-acetylglucosamine diphosphorylase/glucosamine-1-phosphate N-acetyltransferase GlmU [Candidatus Anaerotruncus excrementipullorum]|uniref:Bifunctional protein GlmU n=1 Tax=Candidatus Anaerotruncus excrementipullorum TaxID=2838465 RepID=A0A9D1WQP9_9FIRM|nr:bifunctional UDP-N-acetylglucosamine diphosphorylase/glucosamine-1-phosphate N-acetyltransferase GlmU [Candidatus Anaerotruncus excrementipullorum]
MVLAAGDGKRMKSAQPKVLCRVLDRPMLGWVEEACRQAGIQDIIIVAGDRPELLAPAVTADCRFVQQRQRLGTGHAVLSALELLDPLAQVAVVCGDAPLLRPEDLQAAYELHLWEQNVVTLLSARLEDPTGYGRVLRRPDGAVEAIVEERDADETQRRVREVNAGAYWFSGAFLRDALPRLTPQNAQGEYYLTDMVALAVAEGLRAGAYRCPRPDAALGANSRRQLQQLNTIARRQVLDRHLENGVDIPLEDGVMIGPGVRIAPDTRILPGTILEGETSIGPGCTIGPNSYLKDTTVGEDSQVKASWLSQSRVGSHTSIGPFSQLRPGSAVGDHVKIGDFVELKNTTLGDHTSVAHLTYLGDSRVGQWCNFGCGVVVANYDGNHKYETVVGDRVFVGCNTNLVPPVTLGEGSYTAAGTTVDQDVPAGALAIGRVRQENKPGWADDHIAFKKDQQKP